MATISFYVNQTQQINTSGGSGLGFYGDSFGYSVPVNSYQTTNYITNSAGTSQGQQATNIKFYDGGSGYVAGSTIPTGLLYIPNWQATINIRFEHDSPVKVTNARVYAFDRVNVANSPSGVTIKMAEVIHPGPTQTEQGSGDNAWVTCAGTGTYLELVASPGLSGLRPNGADTSSVRHDWYVAMTALPTSIGSKTQFGMRCDCEFF